MVFSSLVFLFAYLPIVLAVYYILPRKFRNLFLFVVNLIFYGWGEPAYILVMLISILAAYLFGFLIDKHRPEGRCLPYDFKKKLSTIYIRADKNTMARTKQIPNVAISIASHTASFTATFLTDFIALRLSIAIPPLIAPPIAPPIMGTIEQR